MWIFEAVAVWTTVVTVVCAVDPSVFASGVQAVSKKSIAFFIVVASFVSGEKSSLPIQTDFFGFCYAILQNLKII
jgi:hypothetical protein